MKLAELMELFNEDCDLDVFSDATRKELGHCFAHQQVSESLSDYRIVDIYPQQHGMAVYVV